jgi:hypothetical protein
MPTYRPRRMAQTTRNQMCLPFAVVLCLFVGCVRRAIVLAFVRFPIFVRRDVVGRLRGAGDHSPLLFG